MDNMDNMEYNNEFLSELDILNSIYLDFEKIIHYKNRFIINLNITNNNHSNLLLVSIEFIISSNYPITIPKFTILKPAISKSAYAELNVEIDRIWKAESICIYQCIEYIRSYFIDHYDQYINYKPMAEPMHINLVNNCPHIYHGTSTTYKKSKFIAHFALINSINDVQAVVNYISSDSNFSTATHPIITAYRLKSQNTVYEDRDDNGESGAGDTLLFLLQRMNVINVVVIVSRWFGGIQLGPDRFKCIYSFLELILFLVISKVAKELIEENYKNS